MQEIIIPCGSAFLMGFLGSAHCAGMCGPIVHALSFSIQSNEKKRLQLTYNLGRIISYIILGGVMGLLGKNLATALGGNIAVSLRMLSAVVIIMFGLYLSGFAKIVQPIEKVGVLVWQGISPVVSKLLPISNSRQALAVGMCWGLLPCGLVYTALIFAFANKHPILGAAIMTNFGLGTLPAMLGLGLISSSLKAKFQNPTCTKFLGLVMIFLGLWGVYASWYFRPLSCHH